jgi:coenzyme F420-reducing hydrogenase beta subunit
MNVCPKQAISMQPDEDGFLYPQIDIELCMECGLCKKVCVIDKLVSDNEPIAAYAAIQKDSAILNNSSSGGAFAALASLVFENKGVVFGCVFNDEIEAEHICLDNPHDMKKMQGSKYVQSNVKTTYLEVKKHLQMGRWVLYTGTPCQIAGLKAYLCEDYENLITADLVCHGVPSPTFFRGYITWLGANLKGKVTDFKFRCKAKGWRLTAKATYEKGGFIREVLIPPILSYYYQYFLEGDLYRESCYECKYAGGSRQGDFTLGDYWGIEKAHPDVDTRNGVSLLLVNNEKGMGMIDKIREKLQLTESTYEKARASNHQLNNPTAKSDKRELILKTFREGGFQEVADSYYKNMKKQIVIYRIISMVPQTVKNAIKKILMKIQ